MTGEWHERVMKHIFSQKIIVLMQKPWCVLQDTDACLLTLSVHLFNLYHIQNKIKDTFWSEIHTNNLDSAFLNPAKSLCVSMYLNGIVFTFLEWTKMPHGLKFYADMNAETQNDIHIFKTKKYMLDEIDWKKYTHIEAKNKEFSWWNELYNNC